MAARLLGSGCDLVVCDLDAIAVKEAERLGAKAVASPAAVAATPGLSAIVTMLPELQERPGRLLR